MSDGTHGKPMLFGLDEHGERRAVPIEPVRVLVGDMRELLRTLPAESVHAVVTDPPYGLEFMGKAWDQQVPGPDYWREVLRVCKPGGHVLAFGGTRTAHRLACAIEDAGFELRDCLSWLYGSGFPKSHDISKAIDREAGAVREVLGFRRGQGSIPNDRGEWGLKPNTPVEVTAPATEAARAWDGWGTALKPAHEPIYLARKPFKGSVASNVCEHGCGALNVDGCRIAGGKPIRGAHEGNNGLFGMGSGYAFPGESHVGRWPANLVLDEEAARLLDAQTGELCSHGSKNPHARVSGLGYHGARGDVQQPLLADRGGASRFVFTATRTEAERWNAHANCVGSSFNLANLNSVSALADAVARTTPGWALSSASYRAPSTSVTASEFGRLCESATALTRCIAQRFSLGLPLQSMSLSSDRVKCAATPEPTGTTTITTSLVRSDGSAVDVTFSITPPSAEAGASDCARFRYTAKASRSEREAGLERFAPRNVNDGRDTSIDNPYQRGDTQRRNTHPTVKPVSLMRWLVRLITPPGGVVLDPFLGSGSTGVAAVLEGARFIGCELSPEFAELARARIAHAADEDDEQLTLFERSELKPPVKVRPTQAAFRWTDDDEGPAP